MSGGQGIKIAALCGGRAAILPADVAEAQDLSDGAYRLFATLCGRADRRDQAELVVKAYADKRRKTPRAVQKWRAELEAAGLIVQLHEGDKIKGRYRIVRRPEDRRAAALENIKTLAGRRHAKTTQRAQLGIPANLSSHPRCEPQFAHSNTCKITPPLSLTLSPQAGPEAEKPKRARQGKRAGGKSTHQGHLHWPPHPLPGGKTEPPEVLDWNGWAGVIHRNHNSKNPMADLTSWHEQISAALDLDGDQAGRILHEALQVSRRTGEHPTQAIGREIRKRSAAA